MHPSVWIVAFLMSSTPVSSDAAPEATPWVKEFVKKDFVKQMQELAKPEFWAGFWPECAEARRIGFDKDETKNSARLRHENVVKFKSCLEGLRWRVASDTSLKDDPERLERTSAAILEAEKAADAQDVKTGAQESFVGLRLGVGVGVSYSQKEVVSEAALGAGNVIIPTKTQTTLPRVILESHYYGWCHSGGCNAGRFGVGPYFGIVAKTDKLISAFSAGVMFGWRDKKDGEPEGFSIGLGAVLDDAVKSLAGGFEANQPLPPGETAIRYEEKARWSAILFFTRTF